MDIKIDNLVHEIIQWEIHLRRWAVQDLVDNVKSAAQMGMCDERLLNVILDIEKELLATFASLRLYSAEELIQARLDNWKLPVKDVDG